MKKRNFKIITVYALLAVLFSSCMKDLGNNNDGASIYPNPINGNITENTTWHSGQVYTLNTRVTVEPGVTLTIEPGTIIKGEDGVGPNAACLIIARGARIDAQGTSTEPIIFTSVADDIKPGEINSTNLENSFVGLWGGLIILGDAPISADNSTMQIEGIPVSDPYGQYGGDNPADNSGKLKYVSIRYGGANIGEGNEINGLTLGGVGSATEISHIEVVNNQDDGIEFFGGTVNVENLIIVAAGDDAVDVDQGWMGTLNNFIVICDGTDHAMEIDGPEGVAFNDYCSVKNGSIQGNATAELADYRDAATGSFSNLYFFDFPAPETDSRGDMSLSSGSDVTFQEGKLVFSNLQITLASGTTLSSVFKSGIDAYAMEVLWKENTVGADKTAFYSWTMSDAKSLLNDFK